MKPHWLLLAAALILILYFTGLNSAGLLGPDEPRYAAIGREMARSGDWVTPRLWGAPWFEKPALLYWMTASGFRLGLGDELAPRVPVATVAVIFLAFFFWILRREFGDTEAWCATAILATSAFWFGFGHVAVTDLPMSAAFAAAMLLTMADFTGWAVALLAIAALGKGLVPLAIAAPALCFYWRRLLTVRNAAIFLLVAMPWYIACYLRNGPDFIQKFFLEHTFGRFVSDALLHKQPVWFYLPVLVGALVPWTPLLFAIRARERRLKFLLTLVVVAFVFFSLSVNKLPGYILPLVPLLAAAMGVAAARMKNAAVYLSICAVLLVALPEVASVLPPALVNGLSRTPLQFPTWSWLIPAVLIPVIWSLEKAGKRAASVGLIAAAMAICLLNVAVRALPAIDQTASARPLWQEIAPKRDQVCTDQVQRALLYGLNYYAVTPLPDCTIEAKPIRINAR